MRSRRRATWMGRPPASAGPLWVLWTVTKTWNMEAYSQAVCRPVDLLVRARFMMAVNKPLRGCSGESIPAGRAGRWRGSVRSHLHRPECVRPDASPQGAWCKERPEGWICPSRDVWRRAGSRCWSPPVSSPRSARGARPRNRGWTRRLRSSPAVFPSVTTKSLRFSRRVPVRWFSDLAGRRSCRLLISAVAPGRRRGAEPGSGRCAGPLRSVRTGSGGRGSVRPGWGTRRG